MRAGIGGGGPWVSGGCLQWLILIAVFFAVGLLGYACSGGH